MNESIFFSLISVCFVSIISLIGAVTLSVNIKLIKKVVVFLVSLAAGTLIGDTFFHLIPEIYSEDNPNISLMPFFFIAGILIFFFMEKVLHWHHCHRAEGHSHTKPLAISNLSADALHNYIDGLVIASSFAVSTELGIATTIAVILHEIPQEIGDFGVLIHSGLSRKKALIFNFISALFSILGALTAFFALEFINQLNFFLLAIAAGGFIYISVGDLLQELKNEEKLLSSFFHFIIILIGVLIMFCLTLVE